MYVRERGRGDRDGETESVFMEARGQCQLSPFGHSPPYFLRSCLSLNLRLTDSVIPAIQLAPPSPRLHCLCVLPVLGLQACLDKLGLHMAAAGLNSGPHACAPSVLLTEPSAQPLFWKKRFNQPVCSLTSSLSSKA